jgi:DNA repair protein RecN (Recombination protein N)
VITELHVEALGIFDACTASLGPGFTVITGETGAGKTLLVESLGLLLGKRADTNLIANGSSEARVDGRFESNDNELILSRRLTFERSHAYVDARPATLATLTEHSRQQMALTSQGDVATGFSEPALYAALAATSDTVRNAELEYGTTWSSVVAIRERLKAQDENPQTQAQMLDLYRFQLAELERAAIVDLHEFEALDRSLERLRNRAVIAETCEQIDHLLSNQVVDALSESHALLRRVPTLEHLAESLESSREQCVQVLRELRELSTVDESDEETMSIAVNRQHELKSLMRKYGNSLETVIAYRDGLTDLIAVAESADERRAELERELEGAMGALERCASNLFDQRMSAAAMLGPRIEAHLEELHMAGAIVSFALERGAPRSSGADRIELLIGANRAAPLKPLSAVASGGERSRLLLALQLEVAPDTPTLIFDEIDAGIGGAAGLAVGRKLAALAEHHQVLCVTHLPQVAAFADEHWVVAKSDTDGKPVASITKLQSSEERTQELARMMAGVADSATAREHARELLNQAARISA